MQEVANSLRKVFFRHFRYIRYFCERRKQLPEMTRAARAVFRFFALSWGGLNCWADADHAVKCGGQLAGLLVFCSPQPRFFSVKKSPNRFDSIASRASDITR